MIVGLVHWWLTSTFPPGAHINAPVRYRFDISGLFPVKEDAVVFQDRFEVEAPKSSPAEVRYSGPVHDYLLLVYGRLSFRGGTHIGRLKTDGSPEQAALFNTWFRGV